MAGIRDQVSILQAELSLTLVLDRPLHGRALFEDVIRENLDLGPRQLAGTAGVGMERTVIGPLFDSPLTGRSRED